MVTAINNFTKWTGMISNSGHDEKGRYRGGTAGDQTGQEWTLRMWYSRPWDCVIRFTDPAVAAMFATLEIYAAENNSIGYDQGQRITYWQALKEVQYDPRKITKGCEEDCSAGVLANAKAALILTNHQNAADKVNVCGYTGNLEQILRGTGMVEVITTSKYLTGYSSLQPGDILLNRAHHVCAYVGGTIKRAGTTAKKTGVQLVGAQHFERGIAQTLVVNTKSDPLMMRKGPGTNMAIITRVPRGAKVQWYGYWSRGKDGEKWYLCAYLGFQGYLCAKYLLRVQA